MYEVRSTWSGNNPDHPTPVTERASQTMLREGQSDATQCIGIVLGKSPLSRRDTLLSLDLCMKTEMQI